MENNSDKIYYYTSNYVLLEWLKNEKIWATRSVSSNDSLDTIYIIEHLEKLKAKVEPYIKINLENVESLLVSSRYWSLSVLKDVLTDSLKNNTQVFLDIVQNVKMGIEQGKTENQAEKIVLQEIFNSLSREEINRYLSLSKEDVSKYINMHTYPEMTLQLLEADYPYAISFTYENDNRFLWDSYTNNKGVCLEFSKQQLNEYFNKKYKDKLVLDKVVNDIIYDDSDQILIIKEILDNPTKYPIKEALLMLSPLFKNPFWKLEKECRTVFMSNYLNDKTFEVKENYDLKYNNGYKTQDYIEVEFPKKLLKSITTGPMNSKENLEKYIREGLDRDIKNDAEKNNILEYFNKLKKEKSSGEDIIRK